MIRACRFLVLAWLLLLPQGGMGAADAPPEAARFAADPFGHSLRLPARVSSVGTPGISMASLVVALSAGGKLKAVTPEVRGNHWLKRILPATSSMATPFTRPAGVDLEALLAVRPQLVTLWRGNDASAARIEAAGIPVFTLRYATPDEFKSAVRLLGKALGTDEARRAEAFISYYEDNLRRVARGLRDLMDGQRPRVYYASISPLLTAGRQSMVDAWIRVSGGINVAVPHLAGSTAVHLEYVLAWNHDIIVAINRRTRDAILADPHWQGIRAVRDKRVFVNPNGVNAWCTRAAESALQVLWAARVLHPSRFADIDLATETRRFYRLFYDYELSDAETANILAALPPPSQQDRCPPGNNVEGEAAPCPESSLPLDGLGRLASPHGYAR
ncbi:MAG: ABC transporter substrate-binding protein [Azoarcus sp.]|jgi:iron complex transport system substrate-binding protein|nr:ABC transporter substrate-binding protein [Azoarcus sp.]